MYGVPEDSEMPCDVNRMIASPCIGICALDPQTELCLGCLRTGSEIAAWRDADSNLRLRILDGVRLRRATRYGISMRVS
jgi:predicted Fe-S protein YdhL (DUF1289 family)